MALASAMALRFIAVNHAGTVTLTRAAVGSQTHATTALRLSPTRSLSCRVSGDAAVMTSSSSSCAVVCIKFALSLGSCRSPFLGKGAGGIGIAQQGKRAFAALSFAPPKSPVTPDRGAWGGRGRKGTFPPRSHVAARHVTQSLRLARVLSRSDGNVVRGLGALG